MTPTIRRLWPGSVGCLCAVALAGCGSQTWRKDLLAAQQEAVANDRLLLVGFTKVWSPACWKMDSKTLDQPDIRRQLQHFICVCVDADRERGLASTYAVREVPTFLAVHPDGGILSRCEGFQSPDSFLAFLRLAEQMK
jgi:thioredoxin-related protein